MTAARRSPLAAVRAFAFMSAQTSRRSPAQILIFFAMPVFVMAFVGLALRGYTTPQLIVGMLGTPGSAAAQRLADALDADPHLRVRAYEDVEPMRIAVFRGRLHAGIRVPEGWSASQDLEVWVSKAGAGSATLRAILDRELAQLATEAPPTATLDVVDGEALGSPPIGFQYSAPSNLVLFVVMNAILNSMGIVYLRRAGLGKRLVATPASRSELTLALAVGPFQLMTIQAVFLLAIGKLAFGVSWGDPVGVFAVTASLVLMGTGLYLLLGTIFQSDNQAGGLGPFLGIALGMLGGCMWPLEIVSDPVARFGHLFPTAWAMDGYLALVFGRVGAAAVLPAAGVLLGMGALFATMGALRLRRQLRGG